jgi:hypothetical protein
MERLDRAVQRQIIALSINSAKNKKRITISHYFSGCCLGEYGRAAWKKAYFIMV